MSPSSTRPSASSSPTGLPNELWEMVAEYITRPTDLRSLCLVSKTFMRISTPILYRDLEIPYDQDDPDWSRLKSLAKKNGIQYVKSLKFGFCDFTVFGFCKALEDILPKLGKDSLRRFEFGGLGRPTHQMMKHLWSNQRSLRNLQFNFEILSPSVEEILQEDIPTLELLENVDELDVNFAATVNADSAHQLLSFLPLGKLRKVRITVTPVRFLPSGVEYKFLSQHFPISLTHITLDSVSLPPPEELQFDLYPCLTYLDLHNCRNTGPIMEAFRKPLLREFYYHLFSLDAPMEELSFLLQRFSTLEKLVLDIAWQRSSDCDLLALGILTHGENLRSFLLWGPGFRSKDRSLHILTTAARCRRLRQLGLEFDSDTIVKYCKTFLFDPINGLSTLSVLNVLNMPDIPAGVHPTQASTWCSQTNERIANEIFKLRSKFRFPVLAFGRKLVYTNKLEKEVDTGPPRQCFLRSESAEKVIVAVPIDWNLVKYVAAESDLLDYEFEWIRRPGEYSPV